MTKPPKKLGRGLSALMSEIEPPVEAGTKPSTPKKKPLGAKTTPKTGTQKGGVNSMAINLLERNPDQPRRIFDNRLLEELSQSIKDKGVLQPILVRPLPKGLAAKKKTKGGAVKDYYQIVAGERRWQAALKAGLDQMPVLIRELSDQEVLEIGVVENVQRADLNPIEEAMAYQALKEQFGRRQEDIANAVGKSRSHVANCLRLLMLPTIAREYLSEGKITAGHARAVLAAPDPKALAEAIVAKRLSVREAEAWAKNAHAAKKSVHKTPDSKQARRDADSRFIEKQLTEHLGLNVELKHKNPHGTLSIKYKTLDQLDDLIKKMRKT
jgi:ParB family chromosome partitioning protein